ncbi:uncharacterized protein LOC132618992 [Lycium barbarum]|uniref:uncharacterized protein LOC132618992 n=1 Tax=Lycium barbarum TaxID=112863 RepID=UPI00293E8E77|nr:uncharacterized protein LOC132618992 [Lycium barbarum]
MILCSQTNNDSITDSNFGGGSSLRQFAVKEFQKLLSDKWIPCVDDISYGFVRQLAVERKCCLQLQGEAARVLTDNDSKQSPLLQKLLDSDMIFRQWLPVFCLAICSSQQPKNTNKCTLTLHTSYIIIVLHSKSEAAGTLIHIISSRYSRQPDLVIKHELMQVLLNLLDTYSVCEKVCFKIGRPLCCIDCNYVY